MGIKNDFMNALDSLSQIQDLDHRTASAAELVDACEMASEARDCCDRLTAAFEKKALEKDPDAFEL